MSGMNELEQLKAALAGKQRVQDGEVRQHINDRYSGPVDGTRQKVQGDSYLHIAARAGDQEAFVLILKEAIDQDIYVLEPNQNGENPFHVAATMGILLPVVQGAFRDLRSKVHALDSSIKKREEVGDTRGALKELEKQKSRLECYGKYIRGALITNPLNPEDASRKKLSPLDCVSPVVKKKIRRVAGISGKFYHDENFRFSMKVLGVIVAAVALCTTLYFLYFYLAKEELACMAGVTVCMAILGPLVGSTINDLYKEDGVVNSTLADSGVDSIAGEELGIS